MASDEATISVSGETTISVSTDVAWLRLVILTDGKTASDAAAASNARVTTVLDSIRDTAPELPEQVTDVERTLEPMFDDAGGLGGYRLHRVMRAQMLELVGFDWMVPPESTGSVVAAARARVRYTHRAVCGG